MTLALYVGWIIGAANLITASGIHAVPLPEGARCTLDWVNPNNDSDQIWACYDPMADAVTNPDPSHRVCIPVNTYLMRRRAISTRVLPHLRHFNARLPLLAHLGPGCSPSESHPPPVNREVFACFPSKIRAIPSAEKTGGR